MGYSPVIGVEGLLALVSAVRRWRDAQAGEGSGPWCRQMQSCPQLAASLGGVPRWEAFPEVNRVLVGRLLSLLVGRMMAPAASMSGRSGDEPDERAG